MFELRPSRPFSTSERRYLSDGGGRTWQQAANDDIAPFDTEPTTRVDIHGANGWSGD